MSKWMTLFEKELLEMARNFKLLWVPLTFIVLGINQPLSSYYLPQIIDTLGGLPKGTVFKIPEPTAAEVLVKGLSQFSTYGVLIIILTTIGLIAGERKSGVAAMILVKPVSYPAFVTAKWMGSLTLMVVSFFVGYLVAWYYTGVLYDWIPFELFFQTYLLYALWFTVVLTIALFFSATLLSSGIAGFLTVFSVMIISIVSSSLSTWLKWSPSKLPDYANMLLLSGNLGKATMPTGLLAVALIIVLLAGCVVIFRKKELAA